eukprot:1155359-Pelagomonas_calceolata.AAC.4
MSVKDDDAFGRKAGGEQLHALTDKRGMAAGQICMVGRKTRFLHVSLIVHLDVNTELANPTSRMVMPYQPRTLLKKRPKRPTLGTKQEQLHQKHKDAQQSITNILAGQQSASPRWPMTELITSTALRACTGTYVYLQWIKTRVAGRELRIGSCGVSIKWQPFCGGGTQGSTHRATARKSLQGYGKKQHEACKEIIQKLLQDAEHENPG